MRAVKLLLVFFVFFLAAIVVIPFVVDINKYRGRIETLVERQIRGKIEIGEIRFSTFPYLGVRIRGIVIKHRPAPDSPFDGAEALKFQELALKVKVKSLIKGRIVAGLTLSGPQIHLIQLQEGGMNLEDLLPPKTTPSPSLQVMLTKLAGNKWAQKVLVEEIKLAGGQLAYKGELFPFDLTLSSIQLEDRSRPTWFELETTCNKVPVGLKTGIWLDLTTGSIRLDEGFIHLGKGKIPFQVTVKKFLEEVPEIEAKISSAALEINPILALAPSLAEGTPMKRSIKIDGAPSFEIAAQGTTRQMAVTGSLDLTPVGIVQGTPLLFVKGAGVPFKIKLAALYLPGNLNIPGLTIDLAGTVVETKGRVTLTSGQAEVDLKVRSEKIAIEELKKILSPLKAVDANISNAGFDMKVVGPTNALTVDLNQATLSIFDGTVGVMGKVEVGSKEVGGVTPFNLTLEAKDVEVSKINQMATGKGHLNLAVTGTELDPLSKNLQGEGQLKLINGKLRTFNLLSSVFSPRVAELMRSGISGRMEEVALPGLNEEGTSFESITVPFRIEKGRLVVNDVALVQSGYEGKMQGSLGIDGTADLTGRLLFSPETSAKIVSDSRLLPYVTNEERRLVIPFRITGDLKSPTVTPDAEYLKNMFVAAAKKVVVEEGTKAATKALEEKVAPEVKKVAPALEKEAGKILKGLFH